MNLQINTKINNWVDNYDLEKDNSILNNFLLIGYKVSQNANLNIDNDDAIKEYLKIQEQIQRSCVSNLNEKISFQLNNLEKNFNHLQENTNKNLEQQNNKFINIVERFTGIKNTSSIKGKFAENFLEDTISNFFSGDYLDVTCKNAHEADMQFISENIKILIESKFYTSVVPTKEITKFKSDMTRLNINLGIFYSFNSNITGKKKFELEKFNKGYILYLPKLNFCTESVVMSILFMKEISKMCNDGSNFNTNFISFKMNDIMNIICSNFDLLLSSLSKTKYTLLQERKNIISSLDNIHSAYIDNETQIKNIMNEIQNNAKSKIRLFTKYLDDTNKSDSNLLSGANIKNESLAEAFKKIILEFEINDIEIKLINNKFKIFKKSIEIGLINISKTKIKIKLQKQGIEFNLDNSNLINIDLCVKIINSI
jgi:hypothetical protein